VVVIPNAARYWAGDLGYAKASGEDMPRFHAVNDLEMLADVVRRAERPGFLHARGATVVEKRGRLAAVGYAFGHVA